MNYAVSTQSDNLIIKSTVSLFLLLLVILPVTNAQLNKTNTTETMNCKEVIDDYYNTMLKSDAYKKGDKVKAVSYTESVTLSDSADVNNYFHKIMGTQNYIYKYEPAQKKLALKQWKELDHLKKYQQVRSFYKKKLQPALDTGKTVYVTKLETEGDQTITDYSVCNPENDGKSKLLYNNVFFTLSNHRPKVTSSKSTSTWNE